jgi:hypothetical protein
MVLPTLLWRRTLDTNLGACLGHLHSRTLLQKSNQRIGISGGEDAADVESIELGILNDELALVVAIEFLRHIRQRCRLKHDLTLSPSSRSRDVGIRCLLRGVRRHGHLLAGCQ